ncbi:MAG: hypothetical protein HRT86_14555 [Ilumatobacteraceae bacterium]|nr:hypothetical protein [Ilumatobacteraceae bacterium]
MVARPASPGVAVVGTGVGDDLTDPHSALTHLGEDGVSAVLLQAKSRHADPRTLARYSKPGIEAIAALTAEHDRGRRHRR